ncbi:4Fe-4S ferredoxin [Alkalicella caledoniensis]|uniref:4Fe-4S ferredoxin n=1 Tax=Alkalicella caledoniensis TaxID=2731377 RepID=A0A7G9WAZ7_ALKCA|nr:EFR1 family ferrodoxin [Alkalicella caledoniensis]QNO15859.1 4Fe-4S ferredoxin [Alkalicella caledoniensis]
MVESDKILILYHSGAGSTKVIAEIYHKMLDLYSIDMSSIDLGYDYELLNNYEFFILAFPTYHCAPSTSMMEFIERMPPHQKPKKAFVFTTCGLYSGNALREFTKKCLTKNIHVYDYSVYKGPATDGVLLFPPFSFMYDYEENIAKKIKSDIKKIEHIFNGSTNEVKIPSFKLYTILNFPNKILGKTYKHKLKLLKDRCIGCNKCINDCIRKCWNSIGEYPQYDRTRCEFCFKCVHHCPSEAIILSEKTRTKTKFNERFYNKLKEEIMQDAGS